MKKSEILELVRAGYSKAEIEAMTDEEAPSATNTETDQEPVQAANDAQEGAEAPVEAVQAVPAVQPVPAVPDALPPLSLEDRLGALEKTLSRLAQATQGANRRDNYAQAAIIPPDAQAVDVFRGMTGAPTNNKNKEE